MKKKTIITIGCSVVALILAVAGIVAVASANKNKSSETSGNDESKKTSEETSSYFDKVAKNFNIDEFDKTKFDGMVRKDGEAFPLTDLIDEYYMENNYYLKYKYDGLGAKEQDTANSEQKDFMDKTGNHYYNVLGEPAIICGVYYGATEDRGPTGTIYLIWKYDNYSIKVDMSDFSNWNEGKPLSLKNLGITAYYNDKEDDEILKPLNYWDKNSQSGAQEKKCIGTDILEK